MANILAVDDNLEVCTLIRTALERDGHRVETRQAGGAEAWRERVRRRNIAPVRTARDALMQSVELAVAAEELGVDGAFVRVHHFARQLASPFPLLAAIAARTSRIEIGTGVIDMRYENPLYMAEEAAAVDLISDGRLALGVSRGSPETVVNGYEAFGYTGSQDPRGADIAREHFDTFLRAIEGEGLADRDPNSPFGGGHGRQRIEPHSPGLRSRIWWGAGNSDTAAWAGRRGVNLMSSTLLTEADGTPFDLLQAQQLDAFRALKPVFETVTERPGVATVQVRMVAAIAHLRGGAGCGAAGRCRRRRRPPWSRCRRPRARAGPRTARPRGWPRGALRRSSGPRPAPSARSPGSTTAPPGPAPGRRR